MAQIMPLTPTIPMAVNPSSHGGSFQQAVLRALQLPRIYCEVLVLCDIQNYSTAEAARMLEISPELVTKRLRRARRMLPPANQIGSKF